MTTIKQGLNLPISGAPEQHIDVAKPTGRVALLGDDYVGMKPTMLVTPGDRVKLGQPIFEDKKTAGVTYTSPASGTIAEVNRGLKRKFESIVIDVDGDDRVEFEGARGADPDALGRSGVTEQLVASGLWTSLRTRPYGKVPRAAVCPVRFSFRQLTRIHWLRIRRSQCPIAKISSAWVCDAFPI